MCIHKIHSRIQTLKQARIHIFANLENISEIFSQWESSESGGMVLLVDACARMKDIISIQRKKIDLWLLSI